MNKKTKIFFTATVLGMIINSCSMFSASPETVPAPPKSLNNDNGAIMLPQPGNLTEPAISESAALAANESQPTKFKQINEERGPGGVVSKVKVDNPGRVPDYYLYPLQQSDTNNNPDKLSTPSWQWSW